MDDRQTGGADTANQDAFRSQVQALVSAGKLTPEEAADLLGEGVESVNLGKSAEGNFSAGPEFPTIPGVQAAIPMIGKLVSKLVKEVAPHQESDTPDDLRLKITGYSLIVSLDETLSAPMLSGDTEGLSLKSSGKGWKLEQERSLPRLASRRVTLALPFAPRHVRADIAGGQLVLPDVSGELQVEVSGGNLRAGDAGHLKAEVSGGNLNVGRVAGNLHVQINGGNGTVAHSQTLIAEINGGMLNWTGLLSTGQHRLEVNGGAASLNLEAGSSVQLSAEVTVGQLLSNFATIKRGGLLNATYSGTLGGGAAGLSCQVSAGQVRLSAAEGEVTHA